MTAVELRRRLEDNLRIVKRRIDQACRRVDRSPDSVRLVAVTKYARPDWLAALLTLGELDWGENRPQQLASRAGEFPAEIRWHLIGSLQRNKANLAARHAAMIHSIDSLRLLEALDRQAATCQRRIPVLLEVNVSGEAQKHGFQPAELLALGDHWPKTSHLDIAGLMTMAPQSESPADSRPVFRGLRQLRDQLCQQSLDRLLPELSMGMSGDFEVAIEEGATLIRVGTALWEGLDELSEPAPAATSTP